MSSASSMTCGPGLAGSTCSEDGESEGTEESSAQPVEEGNGERVGNDEWVRYLRLLS
jgi:hypothetical protein